ncbi:hypothetical protein NM208_g8949 [Fusarium decemcellulare]|uniref:Uncharacterized protein n=1 Tax=Fusarium decemcellulare TaxID=57161 RepID=A0ACC1S3K3_9HYPO|nr:hypothetical protein NM208_g8949 [Fusarium decemcellulare]
MHNSPDEAADELLRKRQRNRVAQQKYSELKSHIEDLEKKAAVADRLVRGTDVVLPEDLISPFDAFQCPQNAQRSTIAASMDIPQSIKQTVTASGEEDSPNTLQKKAPVAGSDSGLTTEHDFLGGFSLPSDDHAGNKSSFLADMGILEIQENNVKTLETIRLPPGTDVEGLPNPPPLPPFRGRSSTACSLPVSLLEMPPGLHHSSLEARVDYVLRSIENVGFPTPDSFISSYYTASFRDRSPVQKVQETSRSRGLPMMLDELRLQSDDWSVWQSRPYTDSIVRSAALMVADEFDRLTKKRYQCEKELQRGLTLSQQGQLPSTPAESSAAMQQLHTAAAELKKTLRNELPNLNALTATLSSDDSVVPQAMRVQLLLATIETIATTADEPLQEAANWVYQRVNSQFSSNPRPRNSDDFGGGSSIAGEGPSRGSIPLAFMPSTAKSTRGWSSEVTRTLEFPETGLVSRQAWLLVKTWISNDQHGRDPDSAHASQDLFKQSDVRPHAAKSAAIPKHESSLDHIGKQHSTPASGKGRIWRENTMNRCDVEADKVFGPQVVACRDGFDFTLLFEQSVLSIGPSAVALIVSAGYMVHLLRQDVKTKPDANWRFRAAKLLPVVLFVAAQLVLVVLWASPRNHPSGVSLPAAVLSLMTGLALATLSYLEHSRSIRPSTILNIYLATSVLFDVAQCRTLWLRQDNGAVAAVFTTGVVSKVAMLGAEMTEKRSILKPPYSSYSPEAISGVLNRSVFWWINALLVRGSSSRLGLKDLFDLDLELITEHIEPKFRRTWASISKQSSHSLLLATFKTFWFKILTIVFFRLCLIGFKFSQPLLIHRAVSLLEEPDSQEKTSIGRTLIGATSLIYIGIALMTGMFRHNVYRLITMVRSAIVGLIYHTTLSLDAKAASNAAALTLMSTDLESIASGFEVFDSLWADPIEIGVAIYILYSQIGLAFIAPIITSLSMFPSSTNLTWRYLHWALVFICVPIALRSVSASAQNDWLESIERRVAVIASVLSNMKGVKMTGLSDLVGDRLQAFRVYELQVASKFRAMLAVSVVIGSMSQVVTPVITLITYVLLNMAKAVPQLAAAGGCFQRIQAYVLTGDESMAKCNEVAAAPIACEKKQQDSRRGSSTDDASEKKALVTLRNASFTIGVTKEPILRDVSISILQETWTVIIGPVGSGKSVLLLALLDELHLTAGSMDRAAMLRGGVGYCAQDPWLPNLSIRDIICAGDAGNVDETWYSAIVEACVLRSDLDGLPAGDRTVIGSNGVSLSGGQKQRVSLARAVYSRRSLIVLDDVLSGLDPTTEQALVERVFGPDGLLRKHAITVVLATHSVRHARGADHVIVLQNGGSILEQGPPDQVAKHLPSQDGDRPTSSTTTGDSLQSDSPLSSPQADHVAQAPSHELSMVRQTGDFRLYAYYFRALGWANAIGMALAILTYSVFQKFPTLWVQWWTAAEVDAPGRETDMYAGVYGAFCGICLICFSTCIFLLFHYGIPRSSIALHATLLKATLDAPYWFFVSTDTGDLINRFSQDMSLVCMQLPAALVDTMLNAGVCIVGGVLITMGSKWSLTIYPALIVILYILQKFYLRTSRQMRLLDLEAKAPLYSHFLETLRGIITIKAFAWQLSAERHNAKLLDSSQRPFYLMYSIQRWLNLVLDLLVAGVATMIVALATQLKDSSSGALGVALLNILTFSQDLTALIRTWTDLETSLGAVARVKSFESETPSEHTSPEMKHVPAQWASQGNIKFERVSASYKSGEELVLKDISLQIPAGTKVGICGRTGSGKSTFILTLLRLAEIENGDVFIDGLSTLAIPLNVLRQSVVAVPQDPLLLSGTVRFNADPFSKHRDDDILTAMDDVGLLDIVKSAAGELDADIDSLSLSKGQQQLFCMVRALLSTSCIVMLDEMTSSVDAVTEERMMSLVKNRFVHKTVLAIAHHLHTIRNFDMIVVLDQGCVVETGSPDELLSRDSVFRDLWSKQH